METRSPSRTTFQPYSDQQTQARVGVCHQEGPQGRSNFFSGEMNLLNHSWMLGPSNPQGRRRKGEGGEQSRSPAPGSRGHCSWKAWGQPRKTHFSPPTRQAWGQEPCGCLQEISGPAGCCGFLAPQPPLICDWKQLACTKALQCPGGRGRRTSLAS